ncbi:MAG TPA: ABC transporter ATP-binding protein [Acidisarcina sp.]|nr:ABC transporter ATP-binding protein [Acidisarcina sp.]
MKPINLFGENKHLAALVRRYFWTASVVTFLAMVIGVLEGFGVSLLIPLLSTFGNSFIPSKGGVGALAFLGRFAQGYGRNERLLIVSAVILSCLLLKSALQVVSNTFASWVDGRVGHDIRCGLSARLQSVGYPFFLVQEPARLMNILGTESWKASDAVRLLLIRIGACAAALVFSVLLILVSWRLSIIVLAGGLIARYVQRRAESRLRELSKEKVSSNQVLADRMLFAIFGSRIIRLFNNQQAEHARFMASSDEVRRAILKSETLSNFQGPLLETMHGILFLAVVLIAVFNGMSLPVLIAFLVLMNRLQPHLRMVEHTGASFASAAGHFNEVEWLLDQKDNPTPTGKLAFPGLHKGIKFNNVTFEYPDRNEPALMEATFELRSGRSTALIGESGAGKSTVINLLCRLLEPVSGTIEVDGQPLSSINISDWLNAIAIAGQDVDLIDGTIAENIAYSRPKTDRAKIERAARYAKADFIDDMPQGLDTFVGPRGLSLSGGQRQRIGIARALARDPEILILDEATNALDYETENGIIKSLQELSESMTIIVVSHRVNTLVFCDNGIVLSRGRVIESGPLPSILSDRFMQPGTERDLIPE